MCSILNVNYSRHLEIEVQIKGHTRTYTKGSLSEEVAREVTHFNKIKKCCLLNLEVSNLLV